MDTIFADHTFHFQPEHIVSLIIAGLSLVGVCYTAAKAHSCKKDTKQINDAVNHRKPGELRLYEIMISNQEQFIRLDAKVDRMESTLVKVEEKLRSCPMHQSSQVPLDIDSL